MVNQSEVDKLAEQLKISKEEALDIWLTDRGLSVNEEQEELNKKAKGIVKADADVKKRTKASKKAHEVKVSAEKQQLFNEIQSFLTEKGYDFDILTKNKLFSVKIGDKTFKIDLIQSKKATK